MTDSLRKPERFQRKTIQVEEAQKTIEACVSNMDCEECALEHAYGRYLAMDVTAEEPLPHFPRSGMDGFAVRSSDVSKASRENPVRLKVIDQIPCGKAPDKQVISGTAARIMTGAMVPEGADAVIMLEMTDEYLAEGQSYIAITKPIPSGANISWIGSELPRGTRLMEKGTKIGAGEIALLATFGFAKVPVFRSPKVAILPTGSELLDVNEPLAPGKIRNSNGYMLAALVKEAGGVPLLLGKIPDQVDRAAQSIVEAFEQADLVITSGGVSVGDHDILVDVLASWEGQTLFNKVAMRPGTPTTVGIFRNRLLFALSGNPGACFVGFRLFVWPVIRKMLGAAHGSPRPVSAILEADFTKVNNYPRFVRGRTSIRDAAVYVSPVGQDRSSHMSSIKDSDCLIVIPPGGAGIRAGEKVTVIPFIQT
jgi:molybdopterin molybdotransferase